MATVSVLVDLSPRCLVQVAGRDKWVNRGALSNWRRDGGRIYAEVPELEVFNKRLKDPTAKLRRQQAEEAARLEREEKLAAIRTARYVPGTDYRKYAGLSTDFPRDLFLWAESHVQRIHARATTFHFDRFAANLHHANSQEFTPLMDGFSEAVLIWGITICVDFNQPVPVEFDDALFAAQKRCGVRAMDDSRTTRYPTKVFSNELGWELLRTGLPLG